MKVLASVMGLWDYFLMTHKHPKQSSTQARQPKGRRGGLSSGNSSSVFVPPPPMQPQGGGGYVGGGYVGVGDGRVSDYRSIWGAILPLGVPRR